jgi:hypothetical protein
MRRAVKALSPLIVAILASTIAVTAVGGPARADNLGTYGYSDRTCTTTGWFCFSQEYNYNAPPYVPGSPHYYWRATVCTSVTLPSQISRDTSSIRHYQTSRATLHVYGVSKVDGSTVYMHRIVGGAPTTEPDLRHWRFMDKNESLTISDNRITRYQNVC